jgi:sugar (pentulose or hexulose) kinase
LIDPDDPTFLRPGDMPGRIASFLRGTGQIHPIGSGGLVRCILESLALKYRIVLEQAERLTGRQVDVIHVVGGGASNAFLNQSVANATGRRVLAGPVEATVIGNLVIQAFAHRRLHSMEEMRAVVARSVNVTEFEPEDQRDWSMAISRYGDVVSQSSR